MKTLFVTALIANTLNVHSQDDRFLGDIDGTRVDRESYVMIWDDALRMPKVVAYEVTSDELNNLGCGGADYCHEDDLLNAYGGNDYEGAPAVGFQRGHILPASQGSWDDASCAHTSLYSNILPQSEELNQGVWKRSDEYVKKLVNEHGKVYVHAGPLPFSIQRLPSGMPIPIGFWKLLMYEADGEWRRECFLFSQFSGVESEVFAVNCSQDRGRLGSRTYYKNKEDALRISAENGLECCDFHLERQSYSWYAPKEISEPSISTELTSYICETQLLESILGFKLFESGKMEFTSPKPSLGGIDGLIPYQPWAIGGYLHDAQCIWPDVWDIGAQWGQEMLVNNIRSLSFKIDEEGEEEGRRLILDVVLGKTQPIRMGKMSQNESNRVVSEEETDCSKLDFDGFTYELVQIGDQCWFAENLRSTHFANGDAIGGSAVWEGSEIPGLTVKSSAQEKEGDVFLYNYYCLEDSRQLAPPGWHVATIDDVLKLFHSIDPDCREFPGNFVVGNALKAASWDDSDFCEIYSRVGFNALPLPNSVLKYEARKQESASRHWVSYGASGDSFETVAKALGSYQIIEELVNREIERFIRSDEEEGREVSSSTYDEMRMQMVQEMLSGAETTFATAGLAFHIDNSCSAAFDDSPKDWFLPVRLVRD